jgi:hypothetical protein
MREQGHESFEATAQRFLCEEFVTPVGYAQGAGTEPRFAFRTRAGLVVYRGNQLLSRTSLLTLCADVDIWRLAFPGRRNHLFDVARAAAFLIRKCLARGKVELPPELAPRPVGRPPKARVA